MDYSLAAMDPMSVLLRANFCIEAGCKRRMIDILRSKDDYLSIFKWLENERGAACFCQVERVVSIGSPALQAVPVLSPFVLGKQWSFSIRILKGLVLYSSV